MVVNQVQIVTVNLVLEVTTEEMNAMHAIAQRKLLEIVNVPLQLLIYIGYNELTIGKTISPEQVDGIDVLIPRIFTEVPPINHDDIKQAIIEITAVTFKKFLNLIDTSMLDLPAVLETVTVSGNAIMTQFKTYREERQCNWSYSISPQ